MKKDLAERIKELMYKPENIRNIGTIAHIDHGKCISGDSLVFVREFGWKKANELFNLARENGKLVKRTPDLEVYTFPTALTTSSVDVINKSITNSSFLYAWKIKNTGEKLVRVTFEDGSEIKTTPEHLFAVVSGTKTKWKEARDIERGDMVIAPDTEYKLDNLEIRLLGVKNVEMVKSDDYVFDFTVEPFRNFIANGVFVHNTTFSDNLLARAGMISEELAGKQLFLDFTEQEQQRGITIWSANASMVHEFEGEYYLVNLIDTPGHVDFGGDVTRAMRAVDGAILLVCAVEGVMPQTETVLRQCLKERVKPVLFINKVDRLIKELKFTPEMMQERFKRIIDEVNYLIRKYAEPQFREKFMVNVGDGSVAFGSALRNWAISVPFMKKTGINFKTIIDMVKNGKEEELAKICPLHEVVLDMIVKHLPSPIEAQKYRIEKIWKGDVSSEVGKDMTSVNPNGRLAAVVTKMVPDPHAGFVACVRIFSGKIRKGQEVYLVGQHKTQRVQQVSVYKGPQRIQVDEVTAGNIAGVVGLTDAFSGETLCEPDHIIEPFEEIRHLFEPVVTKAIEPKNPKDLPKLIEFLRKLSREDTTIHVKINEETGEYLVSGLGELHIDAKVERVLKERGLEIRTSKPIVVYRETVEKSSPVIEGKSPNKHNKLYVVVEPLEKEILDAMRNDIIPKSIEIKKKNLELQKKLVNYGMSPDEAKNVVLIYNKNMLIDMTKGVQFLNEIMEMLKEGVRNVADEGPLAKEPCTGLKIKLIDAKLHEDPVHRGPGQILPAIRYAIKMGMLQANATLLEPKQIIRVDVPSELMGAALREIQNRRGQVMEMKEERGASIIIAKIPVAEMFGFNSSLKSATGGKGFYSLIDVVFEKIPKELRDKVILEIRKRKGMKPEVPKILEGEE